MFSSIIWEVLGRKPCANRVQKNGCANFVQTHIAPESVQTLCKDFGPQWRVAGLRRVQTITGGAKAATEVKSPLQSFYDCPPRW